MVAELAQDQERITEPSGPERRRLHALMPWWALTGVLSVLLGFARAVTVGIQTTDETWFLYVLHRVNLGEVLYRDVWVPVFPLAIWLGAAFMRVFGDHIFALKAADTLVFAVTLIACVSVIRRIAPRHAHATFLLAVMLAWAAPGVVGPGSLYTALSYSLLAVTLAVTLAWMDLGGGSPTRRPFLLLAAGVMAGLSFSAKQSIGGLALLALIATVVFCSERGLRARTVLGRCATAVAAFTGAILATIVPVALSGGLPALLRDALLTSSLRSSPAVGVVQYRQGLEQFTYESVRILHGLTFSTDLLTRQAAFALPLVVVPLFLWSLWVRRETRLAVVGVFCLAAMAGSIPRADAPHYVAVLPFLALMLVISWETARPRGAPWVRNVLLAIVLIMVGARLGSIAVGSVRQHNLVASDLPHFTGALITRADKKAADAAVAQLRAGPQRVYIVSFRAGLLYLASGREDVTPYDYPDTVALGLAAEADVIDEIGSGRIQAVWLDPLVIKSPGWSSSRLFSYLHTSMRPVGATTVWGQLYVP